MKIYCLTCREYILETSDDLVIGGPYNGAMFKGATNDKWASTMFRTVADIKGGDLHCPRCMGPFIVDGGKLLTEHGVIQPGQKSIDTTFNIVHQEGHAKGMLMYVKDSRLLPDHEAALEKAEDAIEEDDDLRCPECGKEYKDKMWFDKHVERCEG